jgi:hypothetical protein
MLQTIVQASTVLLCVLLTVLWYRVIRLYKDNAFDFRQVELSKAVGQVHKDSRKTLDTTKSYENKIYSLKLAQRFVGYQLNEVKKNSALAEIVEEDWLNEVSSLYFVGAIDHIGKQAGCDENSRKEIIQLTLKSNSLAASETVLEYFSNITTRAFDESNEHLIKSGSEAVKQWIENETVSDEFSLNELLGWWRYEFLTNRFEKQVAYS